MVNEVDQTNSCTNYFYNKVQKIITLNAVCDCYKAIAFKVATDPTYTKNFNTNVLRTWIAGEVKSNNHTKNGYLQNVFQAEFGLHFDREGSDFTNLAYCYADAAQTLLFITDSLSESIPFLERFKEACWTTIDKSVKVKTLGVVAARDESSGALLKSQYQLEVSVECYRYNVSMTVDSRDGGFVGYTLNSEALDKTSAKAAFLRQMLPYLRDIALVSAISYCIKDTQINPVALYQK